MPSSSFPFRRFQIGKVYRGERAQRGRFREFYQADIDVIGDGRLDITNEAEIPAIIYNTFTALGLQPLPDPGQQPEDSERLLRHAGPGRTRPPDIMRTVDKLDKIGRGQGEGAMLLTEDIGLTGAGGGRDPASSSPSRADNGQVLAALEDYRGRNALFDQGLDELTTVVKYLAAFGVPEDHFAVDLTIARGLDYYTGTVYETTMLDHPEIGSICSGGRYDNLSGILYR